MMLEHCMTFHVFRVPYKRLSNAGSFDTSKACQPVNVLTSYVEFGDDDGLMLISKSSEQSNTF